MPDVRRSLVEFNTRFLEGLRSSQADLLLEQAVRFGDFSELTGHTHCLLVTYRQDGSPVAQPMWPAFEDGRLYLRSEIQAYKAKRIRRNPNVLVAACTFRGRPLGPPFAGTARVLDVPAEAEYAANLIRREWGWGQRTFEAFSRTLTPMVFMEISPIGSPDQRGIPDVG